MIGDKGYFVQYHDKGDDEWEGTPRPDTIQSYERALKSVSDPYEWDKETSRRIVKFKIVFEDERG